MIAAVSFRGRVPKLTTKICQTKLFVQIRKKKNQTSNSEQIGLGWAKATWAQPMSKRKLMGPCSSPNIHHQPITSIIFPLFQSIKYRLITKPIPRPLP
jgi:hypothetical protein